MPKSLVEDALSVGQVLVTNIHSDKTMIASPPALPLCLLPHIFFNFMFNYIYLCVYMWAYVHEYKFPKRPETSVKFPGAGVLGGYKPPDVGAGN